MILLPKENNADIETRTFALITTIRADLDDIRAFQAVATSGGFSAASKVIGWSASALSRRVARLEDALGARLLHRSTRSVRLTELGERYHQQVSAGLDAMASAEAMIDAQKAVPMGTVRVTAPPDTGLVLAPLVARFLSRYPEATLDVMLTGRFVDLVEEGVDVAIRATYANDSSLIARRIDASKISLVAAPSYLSRRGRPSSVEALEEHDALLHRARAEPPGMRVRDGERERFVPMRARFVADQMMPLIYAAQAGLGIAQVPLSMAQQAIARGELVELLPEAALEGVGIYVVYPSRKYLTPAVRAFVDLVVEAGADVLKQDLPPLSSKA